MIYHFKGRRPIIHPSAFVHPQAAVTGEVFIGRNVYIGPGAALRGDWGRIVVEDGCNVQENCTIHMFPGLSARLMEGAHIGHGAIIHGATIGRNVLIGMNSVILDEAELGDECIVGALTLVRTGEKIPPRSLVAGSPGKIIRAVSEEMLRWKTDGTALYQALPRDMHQDWGPCEPLHPDEAGNPSGSAQPPSSPGSAQPPGGPGSAQPPSSPGSAQPPSSPGSAQTSGNPSGSAQPSGSPGSAQPPASPGSAQASPGDAGTPPSPYKPWRNTD